ncbi:MAG TPA: cysteine desulfurase family protein, partial [Planctomycetota bacterium]|nr:cysteine desulfurase family protein [Planctomycetota bacterium]
YFDHAATTPVAPEVREAMVPYFSEKYGNSATLYELGGESRQALEDARASLAALLGARPEEVFFTSGGTESDNWALKGVGCVSCACAGGKGSRPHIITSTAEHHAVIEPCKFLETIGAEVTYVPVDRHGRVDPADVRKALRPNTKLVSVMHANNEVGTVNPVREIADVAHAAGALFHTDAVQSVGKLKFTVAELGADLLSLSAHKFHGPKGVGALYIRKGVKLNPFMHGGGQERGRRAGTSNVAGIVGLGAAAKIAMTERDAETRRISALADRVRSGLTGRLEAFEFVGHPSERLPGLVTMLVAGIEGEAMVLALDAEGIATASGSACTSGSLDPSHVLLAMGIPAERAHGSLRLSFGRASTEEEVDRFLEVFPPIVDRLRKMSPTWKG